MMIRSVIAFAIVLFLSNAPSVVDAYPDGAGGCRGGRPAVGWPDVFSFDR